MTKEQEDLLIQARDSLDAARLLQDQEYYGFAASRAYYTMFYIAEAFLLGEGLAFSKHSGVHAAFGREFAKTERIPVHFHRYLIRGMEVRHSGGYGSGRPVTKEECVEQISRAEEFLNLAADMIGSIPPQNETSDQDDNE